MVYSQQLQDLRVRLTKARLWTCHPQQLYFSTIHLSQTYR